MRAIERQDLWVIVILYNISIEEIMDNVDPTLRIYLKNNTYIKWGEPYFWDILKKSLKKGKKINGTQEQNIQA